MSKRQEKIQSRREEQQAFITERRAKQIAMLEQNYLTGLKMMEDDKNKLTEDQFKILEEELKNQRLFIDKIKSDWGFSVTP